MVLLDDDLVLTDDSDDEHVSFCVSCCYRLSTLQLPCVTKKEFLPTTSIQNQVMRVKKDKHKGIIRSKIKFPELAP